MTCARCELLEERVAYLERELGFRRNDAEVAALIVRLGLTRTEARLVLLMYKAGGKPVRESQLCDELPQGGGGDSVKKLISLARAKLDEDFILTTSGVGYSLSPKGLSRVLAALEPPEIQRTVTP